MNFRKSNCDLFIFQRIKKNSVIYVRKIFNGRFEYFFSLSEYKETCNPAVEREFCKFRKNNFLTFHEKSPLDIRNGTI